MAALLGGCRNGNVVNPITGYLRVTLQKTNDGRDNHVVRAGLPIHSLLTCTTNGGANTIDQHDLVSLHHKPSTRFSHARSLGGSFHLGARALRRDPGLLDCDLVGAHKGALESLGNQRYLPGSGALIQEKSRD